METIGISLYTTQQAAAKFGVVDSYIRQKCIAHDIGRKFGTARMLTQSDVDELKKYIRRRVDDQ